MNISEIKRIIQEQEGEREYILENEGIIERDVDAKLIKESIRYPNVLAILGMRRCGKSVLSWLVMKGKKCGYINFDDEALYGIKAKDLNNILKAFYELYGDVDYLVFDEIQNVLGWELFITRLRRTKRIIITGSNSQLLSGELSIHLTGRHTDLLLFPFSFREFCRYRDIGIAKGSEYTTQSAAKMQTALMEYIRKGGLPEAHTHGKATLKSIFGDIVTKDIMMRYNIKTNAIESLARYLATNFSSEISFNKLKEPFAVKKLQTIKNYVGYFESAYLFFILERFSYKLKQQIIAPKKIYCMDTGIINSVSFKFSENLGRLFENVVAIELKRRNREIYYWKNHQQEEVDFLVKEGTRVKQLIQVCYDIGVPKTKDRELRALIKASRDLKCRNLLVITRDYESEETVEWSGEKRKVGFLPLWKWLLGL